MNRNAAAVLLFVLLSSRSASSAPVQVFVAFQGPGQTATTSLNLAGSFTGGGSGTIGGAGPDQLHIQVPVQTVPLGLAAPGMIDRQPYAVAGLSFDDVTLGNRSVEQLQINILADEPLEFDFNPLSVNGTASTMSEPTPVDIRINSQMSGTLLSLFFQQDDGFAENGMFTGHIWGYILFDFGISLEFPGSLTIPVPLDPTLYGFNQPFSLPGNFNLADLQAGAPLPHDVLASIQASVDELSFNIATAFPFNINVGGFVPVSVSGVLGFDVLATLGDFDYALSAVGPDARVALPLIGDANLDCSVGAADYAIWAAQFGQTAAGLSGDFDASGSVGVGDYTLWAANFGETCLPSLESVPEPSSGLLLGGCALGIVVVCFPRRTRQSYGPDCTSAFSCAGACRRPIG